MVAQGVQFIVGHAGVHGHDPGTEAARRENRDGIGGAVFRNDHQPVAALDPCGFEHPGHGIGHGFDIPEAVVRPVMVDDCKGVGRLPAGQFVNAIH